MVSPLKAVRSNYALKLCVQTALYQCMLLNTYRDFWLLCGPWLLTCLCCPFGFTAPMTRRSVSAQKIRSCEGSTASADTARRLLTIVIWRLPSNAAAVITSLPWSAQKSKLWRANPMHEEKKSSVNPRNAKLAGSKWHSNWQDLTSTNFGFLAVQTKQQMKSTT